MESLAKRNKTAQLNIALIGYGKMGQEIERVALQKGHHLSARIDPKGPDRSLDSATLNGCDVCIEFTRPDQVLKNIRQAANHKKNLVIGTTGWFDLLPEVEQIVKEEGIGLIYAPNYALGVYLFQKLAEEAARIIAKYEEFDVAILEKHHRHKKDAPSGGALQLGQKMLKHIKRKKRLVTHLEGSIQPEEIHVSYVRSGDQPGTHTVLFDSKVEEIELTHTSRNKQGFAEGAVRAAEWIMGKKGLFTLDDFFGKDNYAY